MSEPILTRKVVICQVGKQSHGMDVYERHWVRVEWDDGDYGFLQASFDVTKKEALTLSKHLFKEIEISFSIPEETDE